MNSQMERAAVRLTITAPCNPRKGGIEVHGQTKPQHLTGGSSTQPLQCRHIPITTIHSRVTPITLTHHQSVRDHVLVVSRAQATRLKQYPSIVVGSVGKFCNVCFCAQRLPGMAPVRDDTPRCLGPVTKDPLLVVAVVKHHRGYAEPSASLLQSRNPDRESLNRG